MSNPPTEAQNLKMFWYWINERHRIYLQRQKGKPWPWTNDPILQEFKFTNVFRELDKETIRLHKRIDPMAKRFKFYSIILFRLFNRADTYDAIKKAGAEYRFAQMRKVLKQRQREGHKIFTGAYIITNAGSNKSKIDLTVDALKIIHQRAMRLEHEILSANTLEFCTNYLATMPMIGLFTGYEIACDLRYQKGFLDNAWDTLTWANPGPGAKRGINRIRYNKKKQLGQTTEDYIDYMRWLLSQSRKRGALRKHVPKLEMREIEHSLCEFDKYMRVMRGEGRPRGIYRRPT